MQQLFDRKWRYDSDPSAVVGWGSGKTWDLDGSWVPVDLLAAARPGRDGAHRGAFPFVAGAQGIRLRGRRPRSSPGSRTRPAGRDRAPSARLLPLAAVSPDRVLLSGGVGHGRDRAR